MRAPLVLAAAMVLSIIGSTRVAQFLYPGGLTACKMRSAPCAAATIEASSKESPLTQSHDGSEFIGRPFRDRARILHPCRAKARAVSPPIPPVAPRISAVRAVLVICSLLIPVSRNKSTTDRFISQAKRFRRFRRFMAGVSEKRPNVRRCSRSCEVTAGLTASSPTRVSALSRSLGTRIGLFTPVLRKNSN